MKRLGLLGNGDLESSKRRRLTLGGLGSSTFLKLATPDASSFFVSANSPGSVGLRGLQPHSTSRKLHARNPVAQNAGHVRSFMVTGVVDALGKDKVASAFKGVPAVEIQQSEGIGTSHVLLPWPDSFTHFTQQRRAMGLTAPTKLTTALAAWLRA